MFNSLIYKPSGKWRVGVELTGVLVIEPTSLRRGEGLDRYLYQLMCHHHQLPHVQTRAGVGVFLSISPARHHHHLPRVQTRPGGGVFRLSDIFPNTTTSLGFKRELEVVSFVFFVCLPPLPPPPPPSHPNARRMWCLSALGRNYPRHLPRGCPFRRFRRNVGGFEGVQQVERFEEGWLGGLRGRKGKGRSPSPR